MFEENDLNPVALATVLTIAWLGNQNNRAQAEDVPTFLRAMRQLSDTDAAITEIGFDAGHEYPSNFATAFKRIFGFSPKMARARLN